MPNFKAHRVGWQRDVIRCFGTKFLERLLDMIEVDGAWWFEVWR